jgi:hypothetical protein
MFVNLDSDGALARRELDLLQGMPAALDAVMVASRSSAAAQCVLTGKLLQGIDQTSLLGLAAIIRSAAEVVEFFRSEGRAGRYASGAVADSVDVTVDAFIDFNEESDPDQISQMMNEVATQIEEFASSGDSELAAQLAPFFSSLAMRLTARTARVGETTTRL